MVAMAAWSALAVAEQVWLRLAEMIDYKPHLR